MTNTHRVFLNTMALYTRVAVTTVLVLFTSRFVLAALGVVDFGLYSVVAGIMGFMGFLNSAMATSSQRHLTHELGRGDLAEVNRIFNTCFFLHAILAVLLVVLGETVGLWFLNHVLNIPEARRAAAFWVYQFTVLSTVCFVIAIPYQALLTAHEALVAVSIIGIAQSILNFLLALFILHAPGDRLVAYVLVSSIIAILVTVAQSALCRLRYRESRLDSRLLSSPHRTRELLGFSGWSLFGSLSVVGRLQGVAFLLNVYFGPVVNAAYGIANQVSSMMSQLAQAMQQAVSPRLVKQEGAGNRERMLELSLLSSKYGFFLACFWTIPLYTEIPTVLALWLKNPPDHSILFCRVVLLMFACDQLSAGFATVVLAIGKMARYQVVVGSIHLCTLPLAYAFLKLGYDQDSVLFCSLATVIVATAARGLVLRTLADLPYRIWLSKVVLRGIGGVLPAVAYSFLLARAVPPGFGRLLGLSVTAGLLTVAGAFYLGMSQAERENVMGVVSPLFRKLMPLRHPQRAMPRV